MICENRGLKDHQSPALAFIGRRGGSNSSFVQARTALMKNAATQKIARKTEESSRPFVLKKPRNSLAESPHKSDVGISKINSQDASVDVDHRAVLSLSYRKILTSLINDQGEVGRLSEGRLQLIRRFAAAAAIAQQMEARLACGEELKVTEHALLCGTLVRIAQIIGIDRTTNNSTPKLTDYLRAPKAEEAK